MRRRSRQPVHEGRSPEDVLHVPFLSGLPLEATRAPDPGPAQPAADPEGEVVPRPEPVSRERRAGRPPVSAARAREWRRVGMSDAEKLDAMFAAFGLTPERAKVEMERRAAEGERP